MSVDPAAATRPDEPAEDVGRWQWHPQLHETWGGERLYFWRVAFPTYERDQYREGIREVMRRTGVTAYAVYELYGAYDILLRVWLPTMHRVFEKTFAKVFNNDPNIVIESFSVTDIATHWPWATEDGRMRLLSEDVLSDRLPNREIRRINGGLPLPALLDYQHRGLIAPAWHTQGIRFVMVIGSSGQWRPVAAGERTTAQIADILRQADDDVFDERSLYEGIGFGAYLILGRVRAEAFHRIEEEIIEPINELVAPGAYGSRTTTFVMSTEDFLDFAEEMRVADEGPTKRSAQEWLQEDEHQFLEVKGSAFRDVNAWLHAKDATKTPETSDVPTDSLAKAVTGLLNADGGTIVIGALEVRRYADHPRLEGVPRIGDYIAWGLKPELRDGDWDGYERRLRDVLAARIKPDPNDFIDIDRDGLGPGRPLAVLSLRAPRRSSAGARWFYHFPKGDGHGRFWVREGNRTKPLVGPDIDAYKTEKTRRATEPD